jgi:hypothetical protein
MMATDTGRNSDGFKLRLPDGMLDRLAKAADVNRRSTTAEIIARLDASFDAPSTVAPTVQRLLDQYIESELQARLQQIAASIGHRAPATEKDDK